mmetsp:Transcript_74394/g.131420  ORF Transcript_74394/g.131420 Transcript_74394/m.131420 type:complete len:201 (+) Transcript_74394:444-1046(+)
MGVAVPDVARTQLCPATLHSNACATGTLHHARLHGQLQLPCWDEDRVILCNTFGEMFKCQPTDSDCPTGSTAPIDGQTVLVGGLGIHNDRHLPCWGGGQGDRLIDHQRFCVCARHEEDLGPIGGGVHRVTDTAVIPVAPHTDDQTRGRGCQWLHRCDCRQANQARASGESCHTVHWTALCVGQGRTGQSTVWTWDPGTSG